MKNIKIVLIAILVIGAALISGCAKEGCTNAASKNYNADAKKDNGTCRYEGRTVVWMNQAAAQYIVNDGATTLIYYLDGSLVGSQAAGTYWTAPPQCGQNGSITITKDLGSNITGNSILSVRDQTNHEYYLLNITFAGNECLSLQLN